MGIKDLIIKLITAIIIKYFIITVTMVTYRKNSLIITTGVVKVSGNFTIRTC